MECEGRSSSFGPEWMTTVMVHDLRLEIMPDTTMMGRLKQFIESEMRSCSMDIGGITPLYVYRMWGGSVAIEDIATAMEEVRTKG